MSKLKIPYYLNDCNCGKAHKCKVCRSKYHRKQRLLETPEDRKVMNLVSRINYANRTEEQKKKAQERQKEYYANLSDEKREELRRNARINYRKRLKNNEKKERDKSRTAQAWYYRNLSPEDKEEFKRKRTEEAKRRLEKMTPEELRAYKDHKNKLHRAWRERNMKKDLGVNNE